MELHGKESPRLMTNALDRSIIRIFEPHTPALRQRLCVDGESMILRCDNASLGHFPLLALRSFSGGGSTFYFPLHTWLVRAAMSIFQFVCAPADRKSHQLIAEADAKRRDVFLQCFF